MLDGLFFPFGEPAPAGARHLARVRITDALLAQLFTEGERIVRARVTSGLPKGARLVHVEHDTPRTITLTFEHPDLMAVPPGALIPEIHVMYLTAFNEEEDP